MHKNVTLVFDIGKTNKKLFLFDEDMSQIFHNFVTFSEIPDDDGDPSEDLGALTKWIKDSTKEILNNPEYEVKSINFSTYGASLVHLDKDGEVISPFYNYLKPFPEDLKKEFFEKYDDETEFALKTASPSMGFLNSGLQLYFLKHRKPQVFKKLRYSLHFPQYLSYLLTGKFVSDYTSLGCHTGLWDYKNKKYAQWVIDEKLDRYLPYIQQTSTTFKTIVDDKEIEIGIGVHDSSGSLIPYVQKTIEPFVLVSTGTWSICMNYFNEGELTESELENDCLNFLGTKGHSVKTSRLFLGQENGDQARKIADYFESKPYRYKSVVYDSSFVPMNSDNKNLVFKYDHINPSRFGFKEPEATNFDQFKSFDQAYHQLIHELSDIQIASLKLAIGNSKIKEVYVDGGFASNDLFVKMLAKKLPQYDIYSTELSIGSAMGAALLVNIRRISHIFLKRNYTLQKA